MEKGSSYTALFVAVEYTIIAAEGKRANADGYLVDVNGKLPIMLTAIAGEYPAAKPEYKGHMLPGTVAERLKIVAGNTYLVDVTYEGIDDNKNHQFSYLVTNSNLSVRDQLETKSSLGKARAISIVPKIHVEDPKHSFQDALVN